MCVNGFAYEEHDFFINKKYSKLGIVIDDGHWSEKFYCIFVVYEHFTTKTKYMVISLQVNSNSRVIYLRDWDNICTF